MDSWSPALIDLEEQAKESSEGYLVIVRSGDSARPHTTFVWHCGHSETGETESEGCDTQVRKGVEWVCSRLC